MSPRKDPEERKKYQREYRLNNIEKYKERDKNYHLKNKEKKNAYALEYRLNNKEKIKEKDKKRKEKQCEQARARSALVTSEIWMYSRSAAPAGPGAPTGHGKRRHGRRTGVRRRARRQGTGVRMRPSGFVA